MNRILFFSSLVCIFCMTASQFMYSGEIDMKDFPKPGPDVEHCTNKTKMLERYCTDPAMVRWDVAQYLNGSYPSNPDEHTTHQICCYLWDVSLCVALNLDKSTCTLTERKAYREFIEEIDNFYDKSFCANTTRKSRTCTIY